MSLDFEVPSRVGPCSTRDSQGCVWSFYYVDLTEVGRGGFGVVFSAKREYFRPRPGTDGRTYAIKILRAPSAGQEEELRTRIATEKSVHERLKDANCAHLVTPISFLNLEVQSKASQFVQTRCVDIIVTEFCEGGDLLHSLNRRAKSQNGPPVMPEPEARTVIGQVAKGVSAIHAAGFIHRDIKEANIFVSEGSSHQQTTYKLGDFGLATPSGQVNTTMCGTKTFMAPEVDGRTPYGPGVDVWSLGVLLYTLLTGSHPFKPQGSAPVLGLECCSPEARDLVGRMLTRDPRGRISLDEVTSHPFITGVKMSIISTAVSGGGGNRTGTDSGIASTVGSVSIGQKSSAPNSPFVPGTLRPLAEEKLSKVWPSSPGVSHINKGAMIPHLASSNSMLQKTVAANMPSTLSARSLQQGQGVGSTSNQPGLMGGGQTNFQAPSGGVTSSGVHKGGGCQLCSPLTTRRLRPSSKRHQFKVGSGVIAQDGNVKLEFNITKKVVQNGASSTVSCTEHMTISSDGKQIEISRLSPPGCHGGKGSDTKVYTHATLPNKYWPKYNYAAKFVNIVKESTPKITFYTDRAMCRLMENGPPDANFEVHFYNGVKFVYNGNRGIQVTDSSSGNSIPENYSVNTLSVDSSRQVEWAEFQRCHERAKRLETQFESVAGSDAGAVAKNGQKAEQFFPVTLGKRPTSLSAPPGGGNENHQNLLSSNNRLAAVQNNYGGGHLIRTNSIPNGLGPSHRNFLSS